ncbi:hypothetical protein [Nocardiopsis rhodophaea]|uniref:hypothetical protein n=1 Tax=Nocardiopsis rhodophaea TaxID=280238 RepID=UPI0031DB3EB1
MEIDYPRTLATGGITFVVLIAIAVADRLEADGIAELPAGPWPMVGGLAGLVVGLALANLLFA